jgi:predicted molibdopterin-dependent oxidoreductase YjgC
MSRYAWKSVRYEPGMQASVVAATLADPAVAAQLARGPVVVVAGRANLAETSAATLAGLQQVLDAVPGATVLPAFRRGNVVGALLAGLNDSRGGLMSRGVLEAAASGRIECLVLLGADPLADFPDTDLARRALAGARRVIAVDTFLTASSQKADIVLAAAAYAEKAGTTTNLEGRVTTLSQKVTPAGTSRPDWMIAAGLATALGSDLGIESVEHLTAGLAEQVEAFAGITPEALAASPDGIVAGAPAGVSTLDTGGAQVAERNSYDFRLVVSRTLYDQATGTATSPSLAHLPSPAALHMHPLDIERSSVVAGVEVKLVSARGSVVLRVEPDERVVRGTVWVPFNHPGPNIGELIDCQAAVTDVRVENI